jgi:archaellum biogenesis ATPase FlaH
MVFKNRNPIIILIAGKARSGKNTVSKILESEFIKEKKEVIISPYTKYLKEYIHNITDWNIEDENNKPRDLLQKLSSELIKGKLGLENIFINRQIEDIKIYSYFKDVIIINDVRFPKEIDTIKNIFTNVVSIQVKRSNYISGLTKEQLQDVTETSLDNYNNFDYIIENDDIESLKEDTINIFKSLQKRGESNE